MIHVHHCRSKNPYGFCQVSSTSKLSIFERLVYFSTDHFRRQLYIQRDIAFYPCMDHDIFHADVYGVAISTTLCISVNIPFVWSDVDILCPSSCSNLCPDSPIHRRHVFDQKSLYSRWYCHRSGGNVASGI